jgi:hypothetical protein
MSILKLRITNLVTLGLCLFAFSPTVSAQAVFNDAETEWTPPKSEWRQKVLHNNRAPQKITKVSAQETDYRMGQRQSYQEPIRTLPAEDARPINTNTQPKNYRVAQRMAQREVIPAPDGEPDMTQYEPIADDGPFAPGQGCSVNGGDCGSDCGGDCGDCEECCPWMLPWSWGPRTLAIFGGVHGYKGPRDRGVNGNFGFQEGVNYGAPLGDPWGCGYQVGFQALQSNISGYPNTENTTNPTAATATRHQYFFTTGIFRRAECAGWQYGVVFDLLHDDYYQQANLKQIRSETGYLFNESFEIGYSGAYGVGGDDVNGTYFGRTIDGQLDATDQFVIYFRRYFENGGDGRIWGGMTGHGDGLFGADAWVPLGSSWALQNSFNYIIPKGGRGSSISQDGQLEGAQVKEAWSVAINLVWYPGRDSSCVAKSCYRPLLNVADNSLFMVRESTTTHTTPQ